MKILISGSTGFIGSELIACLKGRGHEIVSLVRLEQDATENALVWDPQHREIHLEEFEGFDVVIHLAGENIASGKWTEEKKQKIRDSRVIGTHMLAEMLARLNKPPQLLINASAIGYYGDRGEEVLDESSSQGKGFLADVCGRWETAADAAKQARIRVVKLRMGMVLSPNGGALKKMLLPFKWCLGAPLGSGKHYMSWISMDDLKGIFLHVMNHSTMEGPVNAVSPFPVTNREFTKTLGKVLFRPTHFFPVPAFILRFFWKEMADEVMLSSTRVVPTVLEKTGYTFLYPHLKNALEHMLASKR